MSRGDQSGTHKAELKLWKQSGLNPDKEAFYISAGQGMMVTLNMAAEKSAYTLTDRGTWIKFNAQQGAKNPLPSWWKVTRPCSTSTASSP